MASDLSCESLLMIRLKIVWKIVFLRFFLNRWKKMCFDQSKENLVFFLSEFIHKGLCVLTRHIIFVSHTLSNNIKRGAEKNLQQVDYIKTENSFSAERKIMINRFDVARRERSPFCIFILLRFVLFRAKRKGSHVLGIISV